MSQRCKSVENAAETRANRTNVLVAPRFSMALTFITVAVALVAMSGQAAIDAKLQEQLRRLFPAATAFSPKGGDPPHFKAFTGDPRTGVQTLAGLAFWTTELQPLERGYDGPIKILVGMDIKGILTGVIVVEHHEPYGNFSVDLPRFAAQFKGKDIHDAFKVGVDVDAVSRATISITSSSRAIRNSARMAARQILVAPPESAK
jgi:NosR/NirI family nitrous oxide reductase transcriptional regulator